MSQRMSQRLRSVSGGGGEFPSTRVDGRERLRDYERLAWNAHLKIAEELAIPHFAAKMDGYLINRAIPAFSRIGVDGTFVEEMFALASKAWALLETAPEKVVRLNPSVQRDIHDVRQGILVQADRKASARSRLALLTPEQLRDHLQVAMDPARLYLLFDEITKPWIILPRTYSSLRREHIHYLPAYLEVVDNESNEEVLHVFTRIVIEFLANFTIRFAERRFPRAQVVCLVTAGYVALFCRNLITPPRKIENPHAFDHFLSWVKYSSFPKKAIETLQLPDPETLSLPH